MTKVRITVQISKEVLEQLNILAQNSQRSRNKMVETLVKENFDFTDKIELKIRKILQEQTIEQKIKH
jgi:predicted transcriptional regulator